MVQAPNRLKRTFVRNTVLETEKGTKKTKTRIAEMPLVDNGLVKKKVQKSGAVQHMRGAENVVRNAKVQGQDAEVALLFNPSVQQFNKLVARWEKKLAAQKKDVQFLLGAGDLRRCLLNMPEDGPGDFEVFVHFNNQRLNPPTLNGALRFLLQHGVDMKGDLQQVFGPQKELDIFIKDQEALEHDSPYRGEFGSFEGMGDTSINALLYSPTGHFVDGHPDCLAALAEGRVEFTERTKTEKLDEPKKITNTKVLTDYPATILRLALRSLRTKLDLAVADNPNQLALDASFDHVLAGFELFFANAGAEDIAKYALDPKYVLQFLKMFRKRSADDLKQIRKVLAEECPKTVEILKQLGLNVDLLTSPMALEAPDRNRLELRAVCDNARYAALRPFISKASGKVTNPFADARALVNTIKIRGVAPDQIKPVDQRILARFSPKLSVRVANFNALGREDQLDTVSKYIAAVKLFSGNAAARLLKQATFGQQHFPRFAFVDVAKLKKDDNRTLGAFIEDQMAIGIAEPKKFVDPTAPMITKINEQIEAARAEGKAPTIFVDLDGCLYSYSSRVANALKRFDAANDTKLFTDVDYRNMPEGQFEEFLYQHLGQKIGDFAERCQMVEDVKNHLTIEMTDPDLVLQDVVNPALAKQLSAWVKEGVNVLPLTARFGSQATATKKALARDGLPTDGVFVGGEKGSTANVKADVMAGYAEKHPDAKVVAFLDNDGRNIKKAQEQLPEIVSAQVFWVSGDAVVLTGGTSEEMYEVLHASSQMRAPEKREKQRKPRQDRGRKATKTKAKA